MSMNECDRISGLLPGLAEGSLGAVEASLVETHLKGCAACTRERARIERAWGHLDSWSVPTKDDGFAGRVIGRLHQERRNAWLRKALPAAALFLIMLGVVWFSVAEKRQKAAEQAAHDSSGPVVTVGLPPGSEEEIISRLQLIEEKDFYDTIEEMKRIDLLPLVEEKSPSKGDDRSLIEEALFS